MDINDVMLVIISVLTTRIYMHYAGYRKKPKPHPYRWVCWHEGCSFKCSANNLVLMNNLADAHLENHVDL